MKNSVKTLLSEINKFKVVCGLSINMSKTSAILLGNATNFSLPTGIKLNKTPIKVLGIYVANNLHSCFSMTIEESIKKMRHTLNRWKQRRLTLNGKVLVIKNLIISQFIHIANLVPISDDIIKDINQLIYEFLWNGKTHKVKKSVIIQDFKDGGYKMIDLKSLITVQN